MGLLLALLYFALAPTRYTASTQLYVAAMTDGSADAAYQGNLLSQQQVKSYTELATGPRVTGDVVGTLGLREAPDELADSISATSSVDSVVIELSATQSDPAAAAQVADATARSLITTVSDLERPAVPNARPSVVLRVVQPAVVPEEPSTWGLLPIAMLGLVLGLIAGIAVAYIRYSLDRTVKSTEQLSDASGSPVLGSISYSPTVDNSPLVVEDSPQSRISEDYRQLRTNLQFVDVDSPPRVIVVTSGSPSEGKSTSVANLGAAIASSGQKALMVEGDLRRPKLADLFGIDRTVGLTQVLAKRVDVTQAIQNTRIRGLQLLPSGTVPPNPSELLGSENMKSLLDTLRARYDIILLDCPPLLPVTDAAAVAPAADGTIVICRYGNATSDSVREATTALSAVGARVIGAVLSMSREKRKGSYENYQYYGSTSTGEPALDPSGTTDKLARPARSARVDESPSPFRRQGT